MRHVLKLKGGDIAICKAINRYQALYDRQFARVDSKRKSDKMITDSVTEQQEAAVKSLLETRKQPWVSGQRKSPHSFSSSHVASASGKAASMFIFHFFAGSTVSVNNASVGHSEEQRCHSSFIARISPMLWWNHLDSSD